MDDLKAELLETIAYLQQSHYNAMLILVETLEETGALKAKHYEDNLRFYAARLEAEGKKMAGIMMEDLADIISRD